MSDFSAALDKWMVKVNTANQEVFTGCVDAGFDSIVSGSPVTGAPGQPVDTGNLRASWQKVYDSPTSAQVITNTVYAPGIEDGVSYAHGGSPMTLRSAVGGFHSVKLTVAGWQLLVDDVTKKVVGSNP